MSDANKRVREVEKLSNELREAEYFVTQVRKVN